MVCTIIIGAESGRDASTMRAWDEGIPTTHESV